jgi:hypothetical protein
MFAKVFNRVYKYKDYLRFPENKLIFFKILMLRVLRFLHKKSVKF